MELEEAPVSLPVRESLFLGSSGGVTGRLGCPTVVYLLMKREKYKVSSC